MNLDIRRLGALVATLLVVSSVTGCAESARPVATGKGNIRGINSIVTAPGVSFLIEERPLSEVDFKESSNYRPFDDLSYNFNFDIFLPFELQPTRLASQFVDVQADHEYTVILTGSIASPSSMFWDDEFREWQDSETVSEIIFAHLAPSMDEMDIYFAAPGTLPMAGQSVGSLANGNRLPGMDFEVAEYEMVLTPKNDPGTIIYQSAPVILSAQTRVLFAIFDGDPTLPSNVGMNFITDGGQSTGLPDVNFPPQVRTLHTAFGTGNFDGYFDSDFANVIYPDIGFQELSPYADVTDATTLLTLTPVGNSGATIHAADITVAAGSRRTMVLVGMPGTLLFVALLDDARPLETFPVIRMLNAATNTGALDVYMLTPGTVIDENVAPRFQGFGQLLETGFTSSTAGMLELTLTLFGEKTPVATPLILDLANGDSVDIVIVDTVDPAMVEMIVFDRQ